MVILCLLQAGTAAIGVGYALMMRGAIDAAVAGNQSAFIHEAVLFAGAIVIQIVLRAVNVMISEHSRSTMDNRMRSYVFAGILNASIQCSRRYHSGELMNRLTSDVTVVSNTITSLIPRSVAMVIRIVGVAAVMVVLTPTLTLVFIIGGVLMACVSI